MLETTADNVQSGDGRMVSSCVLRTAEQRDEEIWVLDDTAELRNLGVPWPFITYGALHLKARAQQSHPIETET